MKNEYLNNKEFELTIVAFQKSKKDQLKFNLMIEDLSDTILRKENRKLNCNKEIGLIEQLNTLKQDSINKHNKSKQRLAEQVFILSSNLANYAKFNLIDQDDAIQEGVMVCLEKADRFDTRKGKAFNYMTTCIYNHFKQLYRGSKGFNELTKKYSEHLYAKQNKTFFKNGKEITVYESL